MAEHFQQSWYGIGADMADSGLRSATRLPITLPTGFAQPRPQTLPLIYRLTRRLALPQAQVVCIPASEIADKLGSAKVANVVIMGALLEETECLSSATAMRVLEAKVKNPKLLELDRKALDAGRVYVDHTVAVGAVTQADGFAQ